MVNENRYRTSLEYHALNTQHRPPLNEAEKLEAMCMERVFHLSGLFFLLRHLNLTDTETEESEIDTELAMRNVGKLGECINNGFYTDIDELAKLTKLGATGLELYNGVIDAAKREESAESEDKDDDII